MRLPVANANARPSGYPPRIVILLMTENLPLHGGIPAGVQLEGSARYTVEDAGVGENQTQGAAGRRRKLVRCPGVIIRQPWLG